MDKEHILNILQKYKNHDDKISGIKFDTLANDLLILFNEKIAESQAKLYTYEKIIANSNFAPILEKEKDKSYFDYNFNSLETLIFTNFNTVLAKIDTLKDSKKSKN